MTPLLGSCPVFLDYFFFIMAISLVGLVVGIVASIAKAIRWGWRYLWAKRKAEVEPPPLDPHDFGA